MDALILSAGRASRFGAPKFLLPAGPGHTLLSRALERGLTTVTGKVAVVVGRQSAASRCAVEHYLQQLDGVAQARVSVVENPAYAQGLSTSLKAGLAHLASREGVMVLLADHPTPSQVQLAQLVEAFQRRPLGILALATSEGGEQRPPVLLSPVLLAEIQTLEGEQGAKAVLHKRAHRVQLVEWGPGPWYHDIDTWDDYVQVVARLGWQEAPHLTVLPSGPLPGALVPLLEAALNQTEVDWLAPGVLVLASWGEPRCQLLDPPHGKVQFLITGQASTSAQYLGLLRQATLWTLRQTAVSPTAR